jgi:hypothetical protein
MSKCIYKRKEIEIKSLPWYRKDKLGWPIETSENKPIRSFIRLVLQNIRKFIK